MILARRSYLAGAEPLAPRKKWRAVLLASLLLAPAYWSLLAGLVSVATEGPGGPMAAPYIAVGLCIIPFVFVVLAFLSEHPRAPGAVVLAMLLTLGVGIPVSAVAADAVTGFVAGVGAGGVVALRSDLLHDWKTRALAVALVSAYVFVLVRTVPGVALLIAPALPFVSIGVADHLTERRKERRAGAR